MTRFIPMISLQLCVRIILLNKQISFLIIPLLFLFQVLAAPLDISVSDSGERLVHRTQDGILPIVDLGIAPDLVKVAKKRTLRILFVPVSSFHIATRSVVDVRPLSVVLLHTFSTEFSPDARAPPIA